MKRVRLFFRQVLNWNDSDDVSVWENVTGTILPHNGKVRRDSDDVSVLELESEQPL